MKEDVQGEEGCFWVETEVQSLNSSVSFHWKENWKGYWKGDWRVDNESVEDARQPNLQIDQIGPDSGRPNLVK